MRTEAVGRAAPSAAAFRTSSVLVPGTPSETLQRDIVESLIDEGMARFRWDDAGDEGLASGTDLIGTCASLFARGPQLDDFVCRVPADRADVGFYRFALNNPSGGLREYCEGVHRGLPFSGIWSHRAGRNPRLPALAEEQRTFDRFVRVYTAVVERITAAFTATVDPEGRIANLVGQSGRTDGSYLRLIASPGAPESADLTVDQNGRVSRHRAHIDTAVFVVQPPILEPSTRGGRMHYLDPLRGWHALNVESGEFVIFTGRDFNAAMSPVRSHKFVHEVLATAQEATRDRISAFFRIGVDPDARDIKTVGGQIFQTVNGTPAHSGADYHAAMHIHRAAGASPENYGR